MRRCNYEFLFASKVRPFFFFFALYKLLYALLTTSPVRLLIVVSNKESLIIHWAALVSYRWSENVRIEITHVSNRCTEKNRGRLYAFYTMGRCPQEPFLSKVAITRQLALFVCVCVCGCCLMKSTAASPTRGDVWLSLSDSRTSL